MLANGTPETMKIQSTDASSDLSVIVTEKLAATSGYRYSYTVDKIPYITNRTVKIIGS